MQILEALKIAEQKAIELARNDYASFVLWTKPDYDMRPFHQSICDKLDDFAKGKIKKLMLFMPPQHGKSELATRRLPAYILGRDPKKKIVLSTYSATLASTFNKDVQRIIDTQEYNDVFPETYLNESIIVPDSSKGATRTTELFETVKYGGFVKTVGRGGGLTGTPIDIGIIDDPLKDRAEAMSATIKESAWSWYTDVFETRLHNDSQILLIMTRWVEDDLAGRILKRDKDWQVIVYEAIKTKHEYEHDHRRPGEALWPERHSLERLEAIRGDSPNTWNSLYQQDPKPDNERLVFTNWRKGKFDDTLPYIYVQDYGYHPDPTTLTKMAIDVKRKKIYLHEHFYEYKRGTEWIGTKNKEICGDKTLIVDNIESRLIEELKKQYNNRIKDWPKPRVLPTIIGLSEYEIIITPESANAIMEFSNYIWLDKKGGVPIDAYNHIIDPVRYGYDFLTRPRSKSSGIVYIAK